jgi:putative addiction module component (TIGR02574 family)
MSIVAEKITDQALELTMDERAFIARKLISSLETETDLSDETEWLEVIDRRSREIAEGKVTCQPVENSLRDIRARLDAARR